TLFSTLSLHDALPISILDSWKDSQYEAPTMNRRLVFVLVFLMAFFAAFFAGRSRNHKSGGQPGAPLGAGDVAGAVAPQFELPVRSEEHTSELQSRGHL